MSRHASGSGGALASRRETAADLLLPVDQGTKLSDSFHELLLHLTKSDVRGLALPAASAPMLHFRRPPG